MNGYPDDERWKAVSGPVREHLERTWNRVRAPYGSPTVLFSVVHTVQAGPDRPGGVTYDGIVSAQVMGARTVVKDTLAALEHRQTVDVGPDAGPVATVTEYETRRHVMDAAIGGQRYEVARLYGYDVHQIAFISDGLRASAPRDFPPYRPCDRADWGTGLKPGPGPWDNEPDTETWVTAGGYDALLLRNFLGAWCGYIAIPVGHPWHGRSTDDLGVVGGRHFSYAQLNDPPGTAVHVGDDSQAWVVGFHMAERWDKSPSLKAFCEHRADGVYRTIGDAREHAEELSAAAHEQERRMRTPR